jgi:hypothetical protein
MSVRSHNSASLFSTSLTRCLDLETRAAALRCSVVVSCIERQVGSRWGFGRAQMSTLDHGWQDSGGPLRSLLSTRDKLCKAAHGLIRPICVFARRASFLYITLLSPDNTVRRWISSFRTESMVRSMQRPLGSETGKEGERSRALDWESRHTRITEWTQGDPVASYRDDQVWQWRGNS